MPAPDRKPLEDCAALPAPTSALPGKGQLAPQEPHGSLRAAQLRFSSL